MIITTKHIIFRAVRWADKVAFRDILLPSLYSDYIGSSYCCMKKEMKHTVIIDLTLSEDELLQGCKSNTRNEIRRAIREDFFFEKVESIDEFVGFYNNFASEKNLPRVNAQEFIEYGDKVAFYKAGVNGVTLSMHASTLDPDTKISALLYSASIRLGEGVDRKNVGFANRFLHYKEFLAFKSMGYESYDFTGVCIDPNDKERYSIGQFKLSFGGQEKDTIRLMSYPMVIAMFFQNLIHK